MEAEIKIRTLASADPTLQGIFGTGPFRFFDRRLQPGYLKQGPCIRMTRISTVYGYTNSPPGLMALDQPRFQFDIMSLVDDITSWAAAQAFIAWMSTVSFAENSDFASPPVNPPHSPNFLLNRRAGMEAQVEGGNVSPSSVATGPVWVETLDYRIYNLEN